MPLQLLKEMLNGKYDGVSSPLLLPPGSICDGQNVRKIASTGGWKVRKGCSHHNTTALESGASILSLHRYVPPRDTDDYHFLAQVNGKIYDATNDPPASGTTFGSDITGSNTVNGSVSGYSGVVGEAWVYTDGNAPLQWGGSLPYCIGFLCYDDSEDDYVDYTRVVTDNRSDTEAIALGASNDYWLVCSPEVASGITLDLGDTVNSSSVSTTVSSWQGGSWSGRSASDGTASGGATMTQDGSLTWSASSNDTMCVFGGIMGYWYKVSFSGALSNSVDVISCKVTYDLATMTNKWDGVYERPHSVRFYDQSAGEYLDLTGKLTVESTAQYFNVDSATTSDFLYVKYSEPLTGIGIGVVPEYENDTGGGNVDQIDYWDGDSWGTITSGITDETLNGAETESFSQTGVIWWNGTGVTAKRRTMPFDSTPGYWYRISWDAAPDNASDDVRIYFATVVPFPESLPSYDGVVEFKGRTFLWGDPEYPNRLRYSAYDRADCFSGSDSGYTSAFGDMTPIVRAVRFYNELLVFKENSVWLLEGHSPTTFGILRIADTIGCCSGKTVVTIESGYPSMHADEPLSIAMWMDTDGIYVLDGRKPRKVSLPVDHYFNTEYSSDVIGAAYLDDAQAFPDRLNNEYHLLLSKEGSGHGTELVYNYILDEWYPSWDRTVGGANDYLICGLCFRGTGGRYYTYGGASSGRILRLEDGTADKDGSDSDVKITHNLKTRAISYKPKMTTSFLFTLRSLWIEAKSRTSGSVTTTFFENLATSGTTLATPVALSLVNSGYDLVNDGLNTNQTDCACFQLKFEVSTVDVELELYSFLFEVDLEGEFGF